MNRLDQALIARCITAYRAVEAHPSGGGAWKGETVDGILTARFPDELLTQRLYRHEVLDRIRAKDRRDGSTQCPDCGQDFKTAKGMKAHHTRVHPPDINDIVARRERGESLLTIASVHKISPQSVANALRRHERRSA